MRWLRWCGCVLGLLAVLGSTGCTYLRNRANDASDVFEIGLTVTPRVRPTFALTWNPFNVLPFGYANAELTYLGWSDRQAGCMDIDFHSWGLLVWGSQRLGIGLPAPDEGGEPAPLGWSVTEPGHTYTVGLLGAPLGGNAPPGRTFGECPKLLHLGWIGLYANCSVIDFADFILGFTTLDIGHDDAPAEAK